MKRFCIRGIAVAALALWLGGCGRKPADAVPEPVGHPLMTPRISKAEPGVTGGQLTLITAGALQTFNPVFAGDPASDEVIRLISGSLITLDLATETPEPGLAESWTVSPDGKTWTFKLRAGLYWSDSMPLTADDVVFTWNEVIYNASLNPAQYDVFLVNGRKFSVTKVDDQTVQVVTPEVYAPFLEFFGIVPIMPAHVIADSVRNHQLTNVYSLHTPPEKIVGCGPFRVRQVDTGIVMLERNPEYWAIDKKGQRLPYLNEVIIAGAPAGVPAQLFLKGKGDIYEHSRPEEYPLFKAAITNGQFDLVDLGPGTERDFLWFNQNTGVNTNGTPLVQPDLLTWFRNPKFRQAISCAVDRDRMVRDAYAGRAVPNYNPVAVDTGKWANTNAPRFPYDLARARALLAEIGLQDRNGDGVLEDTAGHPVEFTLQSNLENPRRDTCAAIVAEDLQKLGLKVRVQLEPFGLLLQHVRTGDYTGVLMGFGGGGSDPASQINVLKSDQPLHQWFPSEKSPATDWEARIDTLMEAQMRTLDFAERKKLFDEVQLILGEQQPLISTVAAFHFAAVRKDIINLRPTALSRYPLTWNVDELYFTPQGEFVPATGK